jgi:hypothetical protein
MTISPLGVFAHLVVALVFKTEASQAAKTVPDEPCGLSRLPACRPLVRGPLPAPPSGPFFFLFPGGKRCYPRSARATGPGSAPPIGLD